MKKLDILTLTATVFFLLLIYSACKGPKGSTGATGPQGPGGASGTTYQIQFQNDSFPNTNYAGSYDTYIVDSAPNSSFGLCELLYVGGGYPAAGSRARSLIYFDIQDLTPNNVVVTGAYLTLYNAGGSEFNTITAYAVSSNWAEGPGNCGSGQLITSPPFECTWKDGIVGPWTNPGGDFSSAPASNTVFVNLDISFESYTFKLNNSLIQSWLSYPNSNNGLLLESSDETSVDSTTFHSSKAQNSLDFPKLTIYYQLP